MDVAVPLHRERASALARAVAVRCSRTSRFSDVDDEVSRRAIASFSSTTTFTNGSTPTTGVFGTVCMTVISEHALSAPSTREKNNDADKERDADDKTLSTVEPRRAPADVNRQ